MNAPATRGVAESRRRPQEVSGRPEDLLTARDPNIRTLLHIRLTNDHLKPFEWHACADLILGKVARCKEALGTGH